MKAFETLKSLKQSQQQSLLLLCILGLLFWTSLNTVLPVLPIYLKDIGAKNQQIGWIMSSFALGLLGSRIWLGYLVDHRSRILVLCIGTIIVAIAPLGYLWTTSFGLLMLVRAFHGISMAALTTAYSALVVDVCLVEQRTQILGYMSLSGSVGMAIGPALGGYLQESLGSQSVFWTATILGSLSCALSYVIRNAFPQSKQLNREINSNQSRSFQQLLLCSSFLIPALILLLIGLIFGTLIFFIPLYLRENGQPIQAGLFFTVLAIASFTARFFLGRSSQFYGQGLLISASLISYTFSMVLLAKAQLPLEFVVAAILVGIGNGLLIPSITALISDRCLSRERGRVYALCLGGLDVGFSLSGPIFGVLTELVTSRYLFILTATLAFCAFLLFLTKANASLKQSFTFAIGRGVDVYSLEEKLF